MPCRQIKSALPNQTGRVARGIYSQSMTGSRDLLTGSLAYLLDRGRKNEMPEQSVSLHAQGQGATYSYGKAEAQASLGLLFSR